MTMIAPSALIGVGLLLALLGVIAYTSPAKSLGKPVGITFGGVAVMLLLLGLRIMAGPSR